MLNRYIIGPRLALLIAAMTIIGMGVAIGYIAHVVLR